MKSKKDEHNNQKISLFSFNRLQKIGFNVSVSRRSRGWTQSEMSKLCGLGISTVVAIEKGSSKVSFANWLIVLEAFGMHVGLSGLGELSHDEEAMENLSNLTPKRSRISNSRKNRQSPA